MADTSKGQTAMTDEFAHNYANLEGVLVKP